MDVQPFDVNGAAVEFDGRRLMHKNAPFVGDRYCLVFFNPDFSYHDTQLTHPHAKTDTSTMIVTINCINNLCMPNTVLSNTDAIS